METFVTVLKNSRSKPVNVHEHTGELLFTLPPGAECSVETDQPTATFARWAEVQFIDEEPFAKLTPRSGFKEPDRGPYVTEFLCLKGFHDPEYRSVGLATICLMRGVPVRVAQDVVDPYVTAERIVIKPVLHERPADPPFGGYVQGEWVIEDIVTNRDEKELAAIAKALDEIAAQAEPETHQITPPPPSNWEPT